MLIPYFECPHKNVVYLVFRILVVILILIHNALDTHFKECAKTRFTGPQC